MEAKARVGGLGGGKGMGIVRERDRIARRSGERGQARGPGAEIAGHLGQARAPGRKGIAPDCKAGRPPGTGPGQGGGSPGWTQMGSGTAREGRDVGTAPGTGRRGGRVLLTAGTDS
jgi:hypothetical protein